MVSKPKYDETTLQQLYQLACQEGWDQLTVSERMAVGRWCKKNSLPKPDGLPHATKPIAQPEPEPRLDGFETIPVIDGRKRKAEEPVKTSQKAAKTASDEEDMRLFNAVRFLEGWPEDITPVRPIHAGKWTLAGQALRRFPDRPAIIADNLSRSQARGLRNRMQKASIPAFQPPKDYRVEITPDHKHEGMYVVIAAYTGKHPR